ncbi:amino acid ABC transporter permease [Nocardia puris]|uniref:Amino acid ABC transporter membrane protein (PAAT family) n=1 Tax=Nocardia puris TaxID=208602 RepID=A0A366DLL3_9NOCA|nr:amino acid ABC transporter permease [Nocardia puris]MBF6212947.1 amino acid ABC transporter permease [Nocardia puris]MBF6367938.1 amino acid ABC transporter permease [Nocardia puris]MBF6462571.1 amino acid ABC transporter permease [Nocardia puris]RBO90194.1 amino acid ABC transporter membrane protein (PAAT family) [Nocardia puris]
MSAPPAPEAPLHDDRADPAPPAAEQAADGDAPHTGVATRDAVTRADTAPTVARTRHPWRWVISVIALILLAQFLHGLVTNPGWDWPTFAAYFTAESIFAALRVTLELTLWGTVLGFFIGTLLAIARLSNNPVLSTIAWSYIWAFRSIPLIVQLLFWFNIAYLYQTLSLGIPFGPAFLTFEVNGVISGFTAAVIGLALHQAAYSAEIIRAGLISVDPGQLEASAALGIPRWRQFRTIVLPQAMRSILPNATNEVISLFKGTSIVSVMAIAELFYQVQVIYGRNGRVVPLLMVATFWYIVLTTILTVAQFYIERHYAKGAHRTPPPTPLQKFRWRLRELAAAANAPRGATR